MKIDNFFSICLSLALFFLFSCSGTRNIQVLTTRPALITVDKQIQQLVLVNRSKGGNLSIVEGLLTGELPSNDAALSKECMRGLYNGLSQSNRFKVALHDGILNSGSATSTDFGRALDWDLVQQLCRQHQADALLSLEFFDSDFNVANVTSNARNNTQDRVTNTTGRPLFTARGTATAKAGFRIYNPSTRSILFDERFQFSRYWNTQAGSYLEAAAKLLRRNDALMAVSNGLGSAFVPRIVPTTAWEPRSLFKGKTQTSKLAERQALTQQWEQAIQTWQNDYTGPVSKIEKYKIAFNIALAYEVMGNLVQAKQWATTAYTLSGKQRALRYVNFLSQRIQDQVKLQQQTE